MAACIYIKVQNSNESAQIQLLCAKTKVAPLKPVTIPRLELTAAWMLSKLVKHAQEVLELAQAPIYLWTDSSLAAFADQEGILRVGGRPTNSELEEDEIHPIILPGKSYFSQLVIDQAHRRTLHEGTQVTLIHVREKFWILGGRAPIRSFILRCVICARYRARRAQQLMGQLPADRVVPVRPFHTTAVDYAGPFTLKTFQERGAKTYKGWIAVLVCFVISAVHLELVSDYSTEAFIKAYRRFLVSLLAQVGTRWIYSSPSAPHFGEKWKAAVKSVKIHLVRILKTTLLTYEDFTTLIAQIEAVSNSRPLSLRSDDADDLRALTPAHFLHGTSQGVLPEVAQTHLPESRFTLWELIQQKLPHFWKQWSKECLQEYLSVSKWRRAAYDIAVGFLLLSIKDNLPPAQWPLARVIGVHPGQDGLIRVVSIKTSKTTFTRPITKLIVLPADKYRKDVAVDGEYVARG
ncbi:uncharacterized protein [Chelonus insularis]|uniref:uncharacterized protein n=1 Tax=Chelonus insularis TaxID=460826 RepID=UPI0015896140|nr:uncharacterized protein LOC118071345 [Chelonus insularis]